MGKDTADSVAKAGSNIAILKRDVKAGVAKIEGLKEKREAINDKISAIRTDMQAKGIPKAAFDMAMKYLNMDPDKREGFDVAYEIVREAIELPVQRDLFEEGESEKSDEKPAA